jgi:hypothetical protein
VTGCRVGIAENNESRSVQMRILDIREKGIMRWTEKITGINEYHISEYTVL